MASFLEVENSPVLPGCIAKTVEMQTSHESVIVRTAMENSWKDLHDDGQRTKRHSLVFYRDMRFWLILLMLAAFFIFTLIRFP
jgi:hypothetical protein